MIQLHRKYGCTQRLVATVIDVLANSGNWPELIPDGYVSPE